MPGSFASDTRFRVETSSAVNQLRNLATRYPTIAKSVNEVIRSADELAVPRFAPDDAVDLVKMLRENTSQAYTAGNKTLGGAYRKLSDSLEDLIERRLASSGNAQLLAELKNARTLIAKTYTVQNALRGGNVDALAIMRAGEKGAPLTGNLRQIAEFAREARGAVSLAPSTRNITPVSPLDAVVSAASGAAAIASGHPGAALPAAYALGRAPLRYALLSNPVQNALVRVPGSGVLRNSIAAPAVGTVNALQRMQEERR